MFSGATDLGRGVGVDSFFVLVGGGICFFRVFLSGAGILLIFVIYGEFRWI